MRRSFLEKNIFSFRWQQWWIEIALTKWQTNNRMPLSYSTGENIGDSLWYKTWVERGGRGWYSDKDGRPVAISPSLIYKAQVFTCLQHCFIFGKFTIHIYPVQYLILSASKYFRCPSFYLSPNISDTISGDEMKSPRSQLKHEKGRVVLFITLTYFTKELLHKYFQKDICYFRSPISP